MRLIISQGKTIKTKTNAEIWLDELEERVIANFNSQMVNQEMSNVAEIKQKGAITDPTEIQKEKLKGRFNLKLNSKLDMPVRIGKYA